MIFSVFFICSLVDFHFFWQKMYFFYEKVRNYTSMSRYTTFKTLTYSFSRSLYNYRPVIRRVKTRFVRTTNCIKKAVPFSTAFVSPCGCLMRRRPSLNTLLHVHVTVSSSCSTITILPKNCSVHVLFYNKGRFFSEKVFFSKCARNPD